VGAVFFLSSVRELVLFPPEPGTHKLRFVSMDSGYLASLGPGMTPQGIQ
jgi:hypothetical protein